MSRITRRYYFDKKKIEEMISFLNNYGTDTYVNYVMFNPFIFVHYFLPLAFKFLPESYVLKDNRDVKGFITVAPTKGINKKIEIQKLFFEENAYGDAAELVQFVVSKYRAMGATSIIVKVDDFLPELLSMFVSKCGFSQISYEKTWRINKFVETDYNNNIFKEFRNSDSKAVANLYNDSLLSHFRPLLSKEPSEYMENIFKGLSYYSEYKYIIEDPKTENIIGYISILTSDNENYIIDITQSSWSELDVNQILSFAQNQIRKRKKKFGIYVKSKRYTDFGSKYEEIFTENGFECVQNQIVLTNSSAKVLKDTVKSGKYTAISTFCPAPVST